MWRLVLLILLFFTGCIIPADVFFRNFSGQQVRLQATLIDRRWFDKLPNKVSFYDTSKRKRQYYGDWRTTSFITWTDTTTFYIDVPAFTVINVADISNGFSLGGRKPDVVLTMIADNKTDTLTNRDYMSFYDKFKTKGYNPFGTANFYYDYR